MTTELSQEPQSVDSLAKTTLEQSLKKFAGEVSLVKDGTDIKKKLDLLAKGCYLVAGIEAFAGIKRVDSFLVHARNTGKITEEEMKKCQQVIQQKLLSSGKLSLLQTSSPQS
jgi:hypothetical protein